MMRNGTLLHVKEQMEDTATTIDEMLKVAKEYDATMQRIEWYFSPFVEEWVDLNYRAGIFGWNDSHRGYAYDSTEEDAVVFYSPAAPDDGYRGDYEPYDEKYIRIPIAFMKDEDYPGKQLLAEKIDERTKALEKEEAERKERRTASKAS